MSVLLFACVEFPDGLATTAHCMLLVKGIRQNNHSAFLLIPYAAATGSLTVNFKAKGHFQNVPYAFFNKKTAASEKSPVLSLMRGMFRSASFVFRRWRKNKKDTVVLYSPNFIAYLPLIVTCFILRIPLYPWQVEKDSTNKEFKGLKIKIRNWNSNFAENILPKLSAGLIVISTFLKDFYSKTVPARKILISPILVDPELSARLDPASISSFKEKYGSRKIVVYSGTFGEKDGFTYILEAFKELIREFPDTILITTGRPSKYNPIGKVLNQVADLGLTAHFEYLGLVSREELLIINNAADLLMVCRSNSTYANFGFPWKLGEYCMTKNPIIATKVGDVEKYFTGGKEIFLAEPEDSSSIYMQMKQVFNDYGNARGVALNGYKKACHVFNYLDKTKEVIAFIKSASSQKS
ncbi:MAG: glycosyltransferase [Ignavibacteriales bacterium]|nr:glycosyltransferase [Ignavibacteriales bacterium]